MIIRDVGDSSPHELADIYNHYITHSLATFEEVTLSADDLRLRIASVASQGLPCMREWAWSKSPSFPKSATSMGSG